MRRIHMHNMFQSDTDFWAVLVVYNSVPGGVGSNPPHGISVYARFNRLWALRDYCKATGWSSWDDVH
jgi:hypothetical protein